VAELRAALLAPRRSGLQIGLVPTMGAFHEGHLSLIRQARAECDVVVVSLFVNPAQFDDHGDLEAYPRDEGSDAVQAAELGADVLFAPPVEEVYPEGFATTVSVAGLTETLEGEHRGRGHFDGVTTVVTKLFNMAAPDVAYFGQKDAQQALVIKRLVNDLNMPVRVEVCPTVREPDGLAMSSRNVYLSPDERASAPVLFRSLRDTATLVEAGERDPTVVRAALAAPIDAEPLASLDYAEVVRADDLTTTERLSGELRLLVAARFGNTRLIDNVGVNAGEV
jgi:pantoate--beta-alanine ligase